MPNARPYKVALNGYGRIGRCVLRALHERGAAAGFEIVTTAADGERDLYRHRFARRTVLVLGAEREGVSPPVRRLADVALKIGGTGAVESLNVSVATAVLLAEHWRQSA